MAIPGPKIVDGVEYFSARAADAPGRSYKALAGLEAHGLPRS
jgi:hypothetical protein